MGSFRFVVCKLFAYGLAMLHVPRDLEKFGTISLYKKFMCRKSTVHIDLLQGTSVMMERLYSFIERSSEISEEFSGE